MEAASYPSAAVGNPWEPITAKAAFAKGSESPECSLLTSPDLHAFLQRPSMMGSGLDVCQLASSPDSLFSPKPSQDMLLPAADSSGLFADIFPSGLLFPSPPAAAPTAAASALESQALPAAAAARLPKKLFSTFEQLPAAVPAAVRMSDAFASIPQLAASGAIVSAAAAATTMPAGACGAYTLLRPAVYNLMVRLEDCAPCKLSGQQETAEPAHKRQRTTFSQPNLSQEEQLPYQPASSGPLDEDCCYNEDEEEEEEDASDMEFDPSSTSEAHLGGGSAIGEYYLGQGAGGVHRAGGGAGCGRPSRLEHKRARNREAARRLRQRQRQQLSQLEEMMGSQYTTIQGLLGKLNTLTKEMKCTSQENDLLKHLLTTAAAAAAPGDSSNSLACRPGTSVTAQQLPAGGLLGSSNDDEMDAVLMEGPLLGSLPLALGSPQAPYLLPCSQQAGLAMSAGCSPTKAGGAFPTAGPSSGSSRGPSAAPSPVPQPRPTAALPSSLPPSPFQSPTKQQRGVPSPSKPHTPQRPAMRSPFAGPQRRTVSRLGAALAEGEYDYARLAGVACAAGDAAASPAAASLLMVPVPGVAAAPAGAAAGAKTALLEQLAGGPGAPLAHGVALALLRRLQERQEVQLGAEGACPPVTEEEATIIAATALQHSQGNVSAAVMQLLAWGGLAEGYPLAASH